jgi:M6 family metalloprotease-like protein
MMLCLVVTFMACVVRVNAVPACPFPMTVEQPDGRKLTIFNRGDEHFSWTENERGYTILQNERSGAWEYAVNDLSGQLAPSGIPAHRNAPELITPHLMPLTDSLVGQDSVAGSVLAPSSTSDAATLLTATSGSSWTPIAYGTSYRSTPVLILLVQFGYTTSTTTSSGSTVSGLAIDTPLWSCVMDGSGDPPTISNVIPYWYNPVFNQTKSVANYFNDNSHGRQTIFPAGSGVYTVMIPTTALTTNLYSGTFVNSQDVHPSKTPYGIPTPEKTWVGDALWTLANVQGFNFSAYHKRSDHFLDPTELSIIIVAAGWDGSDSAPTQKPQVWSHVYTDTGQWSVNVAPSSGTPLYVGVWGVVGERNYSCAAQQTSGGFHPQSIGPIVQELGHMMTGVFNTTTFQMSHCLPDMYSTTVVSTCDVVPTYSWLGLSGNKEIGAFSSMGYGMWGQTGTDAHPGDTPVALDAWSRYYMGWSSPRVPTTTMLMSFSPALSCTNYGTAQIPDSTVMLTNPALSSTEYFLVENRCETGGGSSGKFIGPSSGVSWDAGLEGLLTALTPRGTRYVAGNNFQSGLLVLHVDESIGTGNNDLMSSGLYNHQGVIVEEADAPQNTITGTPAAIQYNPPLMMLGNHIGTLTTMFYDSNNTWFARSSAPNFPYTSMKPPIYRQPNSDFYPIKLGVGTQSYLGFHNVSQRKYLMTAMVDASQVAPVLFAPVDGTTSVGQVTVTLTCATPYSTIYYTTDGSSVSTSSSVYTSPITLFSSTGTSFTVEAMATSAGLTNSAVTSATYYLTVPRVVYVDASAPAGFRAGRSWSTACKTIAAGLNQAFPGYEVWVKAGTYNERVTMKPNIAMYGGFIGTEGARAQRNPTVNFTIIDGQSTGTTVSAGSAVSNSVIDGFVIRNGKAQSGGGINCTASSLTISNNQITGNTATNTGGGIYCSNSTARIVDNIICNNNAVDGAGVYLYGPTSPFVADNLIKNNAVNGIPGNPASSGSGISYYESAATIANNTIVGNHGRGTSGICSRYSSATVYNNIIGLNDGMGVSDTSASSVSMNFSWNAWYNNAGGDFPASWLIPGTNVFDTTRFPHNLNLTGSTNPFVSSTDFHLASGSACLKAGTPTPVSQTDVDLDGWQRLDNSTGTFTVDQGCYEMTVRH